MSCSKCQSERIMRVTGKCSDTCGFSLGNIDTEGYVPDTIGIGGGDYIEFRYCLNCGQIQDKFPMPLCDMEVSISESDFNDFYQNHFTEGHSIVYLKKNFLAVMAEDYGDRFKHFIYQFLSLNSQHNMPPLHRLWDMFQKNNFYLEE